MSGEAELKLSNWVVEAARAKVLDKRGLTDGAARAKRRAGILEDVCKKAGIQVSDEFAEGHAQWMDDVAGPPDETGAMAAIFLQRLAMYVDAHSEATMDAEQLAEMKAIGEPDLMEAANQLAAAGTPASLPPDWPEAKEAKAEGNLITRFALLGDPHVGAPRAEEILARVLNQLPETESDFAVLTGDLTQNGADHLFAQARTIIDWSQFPTFVTLGNHDMWGGGGAPSASGLETFRKTFNREPLTDDSTYGIRLIVINSATPEASPFPPFDLLGGGFREEPHESVPGGRFEEEVARWVDALEGSDERTIVVLHHPPYPYLGFPPLIFGLDEESTETLARMVDRVKPFAVFCGHTHRSALTELNGVPVLEVPCVKEWPFGFGVVEVTESGWSYNLRQIPDPPTESGGPGEAIFRRYARGPEEARAFSASF